MATASKDQPLLKISELADRSGVPVATIHHYLREGLLPEPVKTSRNMAYYPPEFVDRIRLIKQLQEERFMPLRVIRYKHVLKYLVREEVEVATDRLAGKVEPQGVVALLEAGAEPLKDLISAMHAKLLVAELERLRRARAG